MNVEHGIDEQCMEHDAECDESILSRRYHRRFIRLPNLRVHRHCGSSMNLPSGDFFCWIT